MNDELWRTMQEPDIDHRLADGLRSNRKFTEWWVRRILPTIKLDGLVEIKPNFIREQNSSSTQSKQGRETDLRVVFKDTRGDHYAILTESKVVAPASKGQPEDYSAYAKWGESQGKWSRGVTVLMAPKRYLARESSADKYEVKLSYEEVRDTAEFSGLMDLAAYLSAGITRNSHSAPARNPDEMIGGFRVRYSDLLREEYRCLHDCLSGRGKKEFDTSQRWFEFYPRRHLLGKNGVQIIHKICNRRMGDQDRCKQQILAVHVPKDIQCDPPDWGKRSRWRKSKRYWIQDIPLEASDWMYFDEFDADAACRVWTRISNLVKELTRHDHATIQ